MDNDLKEQEKPADKSEAAVPQTSSSEGEAEPKTATPPQKDEQEKAPQKKHQKAVRFGKGVVIHPDKPLEKYDVNGAKAYKAEHKSMAGQSFYALVCDANALPRARLGDLYARLQSPYLTALIDYGICYWPMDKGERWIFIYRDDMGKRLCPLEKDKNLALGMPQDEVLNTVVSPMIQALQDMHNRDFVHGNIRVSNMFRGNYSIDEPNSIVLGDALCASTSYEQPALYLTVERAMAQPSGRGSGSGADDVYAFGIVLACMLRQSNPLEGKSDREIIFAKIEQGSYAAVTGKDRFTGSILELLRGVLHDDPSQRWTVAEITAWAEGRRLSPKQALKHVRAPRALDFNGKKYYYKKELAMDLDLNKTDLLRLCDGGDLEQWIVRSLQDEDAGLLFERVSAMVSMRDSNRIGFEDRLLSHVSLSLDTAAPVRYRGLRIMGDGLGASLSEALILRQPVQPYVELFSKGIVVAWLGVQFNSIYDVSALVAKCESARLYLRQGSLGAGIERVAYSFAQDLRCLSQNLDGYIVDDSERLLMAYEKICEVKKNIPGRFIDRHVAAFLAERDSKVIEGSLFELATTDKHRFVLAELRVLASIQHRHQLRMLPNLGKAVFAQLDPVLQRYHDATVKETVGKQLEKYAEKGDLVRMVNTLDNREVRNKDLRTFLSAMKDYKELRREADEITEKTRVKDDYVTNAGRIAGAIISALISIIAILFVAVAVMSDTQIY